MDWEELPDFFKAFEENEPNANEIVRSATKLLFLTSLRVGSLVGMRFDEVDYENGLINVPAKRMKSKEDLQVPLTPEIKKVIKHMKTFNGDQEYVFYSAKLGLSSIALRVEITASFNFPSSVNRVPKLL